MRAVICRNHRRFDWTHADGADPTSADAVQKAAGRCRRRAGPGRRCLVRVFVSRRLGQGKFRAIEPVPQGLAALRSDASRMGQPDHRAGGRAGVPRRDRHRRQDRDRRGPIDAGVLALCRPRHQTAGPARRQRHPGTAAVRDRSRRHRAGAERFHRRHDRPEQGAVGARSRADAGQPRQGPVRGQGRSAEGLPAEPGHADPGPERSALVADGAGSGAQQAAHPWPDRRGDLGLSGKGPHRSRIP